MGWLLRGADMMSRSDSKNAASRFKRRIRLERPVTTQDSIGDTLTTWVLEQEVWADIQPRSGQEEFRHHLRRQRITHDITIRYRADIGAGWRVVYGSRVLQIHAVINHSESNEILVLNVEET